MESLHQGLVETGRAGSLGDGDELFNSVLVGSLDAILLVLADGTIRECNRAAETMFGCPRDQLIGCDLSLFIRSPREAEWLMTALDGSGPVKATVVAVRKELGHTVRPS